jgi:hypothetical protein
MRDSQVYSVQNYTDEECYHILGLSYNTTDEELEHALRTNCAKYKQIKNERGTQLYSFFTDMYERFFVRDSDDDDDDTTDETIKEGFFTEDDDEENTTTVNLDDYVNSYYIGQTPMMVNQNMGVTDTSYVNVDSVYDDDVEEDEPEAVVDVDADTGEFHFSTDPSSSNNADNIANINALNNDGEITLPVAPIEKKQFAKSIYNYDPDEKTTNEFSITKDVEYTPGQLNPLLKETVKRTIYINSQDRDGIFNERDVLTTDFHFYLEETLKNVVSLKLYAVQIPYTWYTIDNAYGSNFIYLKSDTPGLQTSNHEYKIEIPAGNYSRQNLCTEINTKMQELSNDYTDVSFGTSKIEYDQNRSRPTFTIDFEKVYDASEYDIIFTDAPDEDGSYNSIAKFFGFTNQLSNTINHRLDTQTSFALSDVQDISFTIVEYIADPINIVNSISHAPMVTSSTSSSSSSSSSTSSSSTSSNIRTLMSATYATFTDFSTNIGSALSSEASLENSFVQINETYNAGTNTIDVSYQWYIEYNRYCGNAPETNYKLAIAFDATDVSSQQVLGFHSTDISFTDITSTSTSTSTSTRYYDLNPFTVYGLDPVQEPITTIVPPMHVTFQNTFIRNLTVPLVNPSLEFEPIIDFSINIDLCGTNTLELDAFAKHVCNTFTGNRNSLYPDGRSNTTTLELIEDQETNLNFIQMNVQIDTVLDGSANTFEVDPISKGIVLDFSGFLHDRLFLRTHETTYTSEQDNTTQITRTTVDISYDSVSRKTTYTYKSIHPQITTVQQGLPLATETDSPNAEYIIYMKGNSSTEYKDLSINLLPQDAIYANNNSLNLSNIIQTQYGLGDTFTVNYRYETFPDRDISNQGFPQKIDDVSLVPLTFYELKNDDKLAQSTLEISFYKHFEPSDYIVEFRESTLTEPREPITIFEETKWYELLQFEDASKNMAEITGNERNIIQSGNIDFQKLFTGFNQSIQFRPQANSLIAGGEPIIFDIPRNKTSTEIIDALNTFCHSHEGDTTLRGTFFYVQPQSKKMKIRNHINRRFTTRDYKLVCFDESSFVECNASTRYTRNAKRDTTLGYILGFRKQTEYGLSNDALESYRINVPSVQANTSASITGYPNAIKIESDSVLSVSIYNTLMIILEDYNQNHLNGGLVTVTQRDTKIRNSKLYRCDPFTAVVADRRTRNLTEKQILAQEARNIASNQTAREETTMTSLKDVFAVVPIKAGLTTGDIFVEFGGTLQAQERTYFGPVNISRLRVKLVTDKGNLIDLNGAHWSFQLICEQLYQQPNT